jgi:hypothetical protein
MFLLREVPLKEGYPAVFIFIFARRMFLKEFKPAISVIIFTRHEIWVFSSKFVIALPVLLHAYIFDLRIGITLKGIPATLIIPLAWRTGHEGCNPAQIIVLKCTRKHIWFFLNNPPEPVFLAFPVLVTTFRSNPLSTSFCIFLLREVSLKEGYPAPIIVLFAGRILHKPLKPALIIIFHSAGKFVRIVDSPCIDTVPVSVSTVWSVLLRTVFWEVKVGPRFPALVVVPSTRWIIFQPSLPALLIFLVVIVPIVLNVTWETKFVVLCPIVLAFPILFFTCRAIIFFTWINRACHTWVLRVLMGLLA